MKYELYGGEVQLDFDEKKHVYTVDGKKTPSVTGITGLIDKSGPLMWWGIGQCIEWVQHNLPDFDLSDEVAATQFWHDAHRAHLRSSKRAIDIGNLAHAWIEDYLAGKSPDLPKNPELRSTIDSWLEWASDTGLVAYDLEFKVYSQEHGFAGTADYDGMVGKDRAIVDWKTSKAIYPEYELQLNAYRIAREEELDVEYDAVYCVALPKDGGKIKVKRYEPSARAEKGFLGALDLWRALKEKR